MRGSHPVSDDGGVKQAYGYDANANRCDLTATATPSVCDGTSSGSLRYDDADRLTVSPAGSGYGYDGHGNLTGYTPTGGGSVTIGYDASDHATVIDDGVTRVEETLAPSGRVLARKATTVATGQVTENAIYGYDSPGDSPAWAAPAGTDFSAVVTYLDGAWFYGPVPVYELANGHGDIVGTAYQNGTFTPTPGADEYGNGTPPANRRGWLAAHDRFTTHPAQHLYRMGVRLYDPTTGRFTQPDPVEGGSANNYDYVQADPLNSTDLDGTYCGSGVARRIKKRVWNSRKRRYETRTHEICRSIARGLKRAFRGFQNNNRMVAHAKAQGVNRLYRAGCSRRTEVVRKVISAPLPSKSRVSWAVQVLVWTWDGVCYMGSMAKR